MPCAVHDNRTVTTACMSQRMSWPKHVRSLPNLASLYVSEIFILHKTASFVVCNVSFFRLISFSSYN
jgi:hypothetical protein